MPSSSSQTFLRLHDSIAYWAAQSPNAVAIDEGGKTVTYADLHDRAERMAGLLAAHGVRRRDRVAVLLNNGIEACIALLGINRADAAFVCLNPVYPAMRIAYIVGDAAPKAIITSRELWPQIDEAFGLLIARGETPPTAVIADLAEDETAAPLSGPSVTVLGAGDLSAASPLAARSKNIDEDLAYILYTSGTTGNPKGVMISHRAAMATIRWGVEHFSLNANDRMSNHSRLSFDVSLFDIFCAFLAGATLCPIVSLGDMAFPAKFIISQRITIWFSVPGVISAMEQTRQLSTMRFETLRAALFAGEPLSPSAAAAWREHQPHVPIYNLYGPTEAAIVCTVFNVGVDAPLKMDQPMPIGWSIPNCELLILKLEEDEPADAGEVGRLMICGIKLANGYWRQPELTAGAFRPNPLKAEIGALMYDTGDLASVDETGLITFLGRRDSQVKVRGYRIELGEIEAAIDAYPEVSESAAIIDPRDPHSIVAIVVAKDEGTFDADTLIEALEERLPPYMVPHRIVRIGTMPRNDNGKIDRNELGDLVERS